MSSAAFTRVSRFAAPRMEAEIWVTPTRCRENRSFSEITPVRRSPSATSTWRKPCRAMSMAASKAWAVGARETGLGVMTSRMGVFRSVPGRMTRLIRSRTVNTPTGRSSPSTTTMALMVFSWMVSRAWRRGVSGEQVIGLRRAMLDRGLRRDCCSAVLVA
jgi:hypothetical protein